MTVALLLALVLIAALLAVLLAYVAFSARHAKASGRPLAPVGRTGSVERELNPVGFVIVEGELWRARLRDGGRLGPGRLNVRVVGASGCELEVERLV